MKGLSIKKGNIVYRGDRKYEVISAIDFDKALLRDPEGGNTEVLPIHQLRAEPESEMGGRNSNMRHLEHIPDKLWERAKERYEIIKPLVRPSRTRKDVEDRAKQRGVSPMTIYRSLKQFETTGTLSSLVPMHENRGGKGTYKIDERVQAIISQTIEEIYLTSQRLTPQKVYQEIKKRCKNAGLQAPHENTVRNRINEISKREAVKKREGADVSSDLYEAAAGSFSVSHPLDVIQIDHTKLDIILVDEVYRRTIGRPFITTAMDIFSRVVYGFYLSLDPPSFFTVGQCLYIGILPKKEFLRRLGIDGEWNIWGLPKSMTLHVDNAREFRGKDLHRLCEEYGISVSFRPKKMPKFGGHIERFIGTLNKELHSLPGTTFSNTLDRGQYDSEGKAIMTIKELESWVAQFIVNVYHNRVHSEIGMTPKKKYEMGIFGDETTPGIGLPEIIQGDDAIRLKTTLLPSIERTVQKNGVTVENITYYSDVLRKYVRLEEVGSKKRRKFLFKYDPRDISTLYFYAPDLKEYFPIPYRNIGMPPISVWELREAQKYLKEKNIADYDENDIFKAYAEMKRIEKAAVEKSKSARRKQAVKQHHKEKMGESKGTVSVETEPLHRAVKNKPQGVQKAVESRVDDIFSDPKPFDDIEIVSKKPEEGE